MSSNVILEVKNSVAHVTLNRPEAANGINKEMAEELDSAARTCEHDNAVRAILISGAGRFFCAGGDLKSFAGKSETDLPRYLEEVTSHLHRAISRFARMRSPVVAAVHGSAAGAGLGQVVDMATDGEPTGQAQADSPAIRAHLAGLGSSGLRGVRRFAGS